MASHLGRAVSITKSGKMGFLEINDDALEEVLIRPDIGDRPIAIISIAGSMRTGKSFIQNFLLRYLRNRGWENDSWMGTDDTSADDGMTWRGGRQRTTTGIIIWDEVFYVPDASGREVAVLIMDTQGLFDNETIKENNVKLFTLSALMSSVQVLNVMRQIEERDLENLQLCVEFATKAAQQSEAQFKLQKLLFLVRDYSFELEYGLKDGNKYLEEVLRPRSGRDQLTEIRSHLRSSFSNICCFLMPSPGEKVTSTKKKFEGTNKEIHKEFLEELPSFVESLLHPKNLLAKISNGKLVTAMEIRNLILACDRIFVEGKLPPIQTLLEATTKAHYETHYQTCMKNYTEGIKDILVSESYIDESLLKDIHEDAMKSAMDSFDSALKVGSGRIRKKYRDNLTQSCEEKYDNMRKSNEKKQEKILGDLEKIRIGRQIQYEKEMKEVLIGGPIEDSEFKQHHRSVMEKAIINFKKQSEDEKYEKFRRDHEQQLIDDISKYFDKERKENGERNEIEKKRRMEKEQTDVEIIHHSLLDIYSKSLRKIYTAQSTPAEQLEEHHIKCMETVKLQYTSQTAKYEWLPGDYWVKLKNDMIGVYKQEEKSNQDKIQKEQELEEEKDKLELHKITEQSKLDYENKLETMLESGELTDEQLKQTEKLQEDYVKEFQTKVVGNSALTPDWESNLGEKLKTVYAQQLQRYEQRLKREKEQLKKEERLELTEKLHLLTAEYKDNLTKQTTDGHMKPEVLEALMKVEASKQIKSLEGAGVMIETDAFVEQLKEKMAEFDKKIEETNERNKKIMEKTIKAESREGVQMIKDTMIEKMSDTYLDINELKNEYNKGVRTLEGIFKDVPADFASEYKKEWETQLDEEWEKIEKINKKNRELRIKIRRPSSPDPLMNLFTDSLAAAAFTAPFNPTVAAVHTSIALGTISVAVARGFCRLFQ